MSQYFRSYGIKGDQESECAWVSSSSKLCLFDQGVGKQIFQDGARDITVVHIHDPWTLPTESESVTLRVVSAL